jgi:hypothetical protein
MADDLQSKAAEMMKKVLTVGVGTIFLTEESLRGLIGELKVPKELLGGILESAQKTKDEFLKNLSKDVMSRVSDKIDPVTLVEEFLSRNDIDFHIKMSFKPKEKSKDKSHAPEETKPHAKSHSHSQKHEDE